MIVGVLLWRFAGGVNDSVRAEHVFVIWSYVGGRAEVGWYGVCFVNGYSSFLLLLSVLLCCPYENTPIQIY